MDDIVNVIAPFVVFPVVALGFMWIVKFFDDRRTVFDEDEEMLSKKNLSVSLRKSGIYLGMAFGLSGALAGRTQGILDDLLSYVIAGATLMVLLFVAFVVNDRLMLPKVEGDKAVREGNTAVGLVEFASTLSSGIIMHGAFSGEGGGIVAAGAFFLLGQAALVIAFYVYEAVTPRKLCEEIEIKQNAAAGMDVAGMLVALAIILRASVAGSFTGWVPGLEGFGIYFVAGLVALLGFRFLTNALFLPKASYDRQIAGERNLPVATLSSAVQVALALVIAGTF